MTQACPPFSETSHITARCLDFACNNNVQDLNKLKLRLCLDSFHFPTAIHVWLLEVISVNYHHYSNSFEPVVSTFYVVGRLHRLVFTMVHARNFSLTKTFSASNFIRSINNVKNHLGQVNRVAKSPKRCRNGSHFLPEYKRFSTTDH